MEVSFITIKILKQWRSDGETCLFTIAVFTVIIDLLTTHLLYYIEKVFIMLENSIALRFLT